MDPFQRWLADRPVAVAMAVALAAGLVLGLQERAWALGGTMWVLLFLPAAVAWWHGGAGRGMFAAGIGIAATLVAPVTVMGSEVVPQSLLQAAVRLGLAGTLFLLLSRLQSGDESGQASPPWLDPSTGLVNAHALFDHVAGELERAQRYGRPFTLLYLSVDSLPVIRECRGDDDAQDALRRVAHHLKGSLRAVDLVARLREREYAVLLPETAVEAARVVLGRIRRTLIAATVEDPEEISFAIGATTWLRADLSVEELHQRTYQLMYAAQRNRERVQHEVLEEGTVETVAHRHLTLRR